MTARLLLLLLVAAGSAPAVPGAPLPFSAAARVQRVENLSRTSDPATLKDASILGADLRTHWRRQLTADWQLGVEALAGYEAVPDFPALDTARVGVRGELRRKFGLGPFAPVLDLHLAPGREEVDERGRGNWMLEGGARLGRRFGQAWHVAAGVDWTRRYARAEPFDLRHRRTWLEATWTPGARWQLGAGASRIDGELTANAAGGNWATALAGGFGPRVAGYYNSVPWHTTNTFGSGWVAYRVDARAESWSLGATARLGDRLVLPLRYERVDVVNRVGVRYASEIWSLSLSRRF